jgi:hypothetical protein
MGHSPVTGWDAAACGVKQHARRIQNSLVLRQSTRNKKSRHHASGSGPLSDDSKALLL